MDYLQFSHCMECKMTKNVTLLHKEISLELKTNHYDLKINNNKG